MTSFIDQLVAGAKQATGATAELSTARQRATDAVRTLARVGHADDANTVLAEASATIDYDQIAKNADLSDVGKTKAAAARYIAHMNDVAAKLESAANRYAKQANDDAANVLGIAGLNGDHASLSIARRDADQRVAKETNSVNLQRLLAQATRNGDETMARAVVDQALAIKDADVLNAYTDARPQHAEAVARMWANANRPTTTTAEHVAHMRLAAVPPLLGKLSANQIEAAAAADAG